MSDPSRREVLGWLLGVAAAGTGCRRLLPSFARELPPGLLRGADFALGHRLLVRPPAPTLDVPERCEVAIVGGGISGLTAAWALRHGGVEDVRVWELEAQAGGNCQSGTEGASPHPWGGHYLPVPPRSSPELRQLLREVGAWNGERDEPLEEQIVRFPQERLYFQGAWHFGLFPSEAASPREKEELAAFEAEVGRWSGWRDARQRRAFCLPLDESGESGELRRLDGLTAAAWLDEKGITSALVRWYLEYGMRDDYGASLAQVSAWALLHYHAARREEPDEDSPPFLTWPEGNGRLVAGLTRGLDGRLRTGLLTTSVEELPSGKVRVVAWEQQAQRWRVLLADHCVLAVPQAVRQRLMESSQGLWRPQVAPWLVANLHLKGGLREGPVGLCWDNVIHGTPSLGYVSATHQSLREGGPKVFTYYRPLWEAGWTEERKRLLALTQPLVAEAVMAELGTVHPDLASQVQRLDVWRWGHAMAVPSPGSRFSPQRLAASVSTGRVHFAHTDLSGLSLFEEAFHHGLRAAAAIQRARQGADPSRDAAPREP